MIEKAYAKVNLSLDIKGVREDGYHLLESVMIPVDLYDVLEFAPADEMSYTGDMVFDEHNTIVKAFDLAFKRFGLKQAYHVTLHKNIPMQAGLAGGSADAAAVLRFLSCQLPHVNAQQWQEAALCIGADVPFCLSNTPALVSGIGEIIEPFECTTELKMLLIKPQGGVSTKECFKKMDECVPVHTDSRRLMYCLQHNRYREALPYMVNALEYPARCLQKEIDTLIDELNRFPFDRVLMSGSGSTLMALSQNDDLLDEALSVFANKQIFACKTCNRLFK